MATPFVDDDADLALLQDRNVAVLGYDDSARAAALCLRDSGVDVRVGTPSESPGAADAEADGLRVVTAYEACEEADLVVLLGDDTADPSARQSPVGQSPAALLADVVTPSLVAGDVVVLGPQVEWRYDAGTEAAAVDVMRVIAWADGKTQRDEFSLGRGVPMLASVVQDASGAAWDVALAYARAVGATRAGVLRVGDGEYATAWAATHALFHGQLLTLVRSRYADLVASGCQPEVAYLLCFRGLTGFAAELDAGTLDTAVTAGASPGFVDHTYAAAAAAVRSLSGSSSSSSSSVRADR